MPPQVTGFDYLKFTVSGPICSDHKNTESDLTKSPRQEQRAAARDMTTLRACRMAVVRADPFYLSSTSRFVWPTL